MWILGFQKPNNPDWEQAAAKLRWITDDECSHGHIEQHHGMDPHSRWLTPLNTY